MACLHEYSILHRDIKPENVLFASPPGEMRARAAGAAGTAAPLASVGLRRGAKGGKTPELSVPVVKLVDLGMSCIYDPAKPIYGEGAGGQLCRLDRGLSTLAW